MHGGYYGVAGRQRVEIGSMGAKCEWICVIPSIVLHYLGLSCLICIVYFF